MTQVAPKCSNVNWRPRIRAENDAKNFAQRLAAAAEALLPLPENAR